MANLTFDTSCCVKWPQAALQGANAYATAAAVQRLWTNLCADPPRRRRDDRRGSRTSSDPGVVAHDPETGDIPTKSCGDLVDRYVAGTYVLRYSVMDTAGNQVSTPVRCASPAVPTSGMLRQWRITHSYGTAFAGADGNILGRPQTGSTVRTRPPSLAASPGFDVRRPRPKITALWPTSTSCIPRTSKPQLRLPSYRGHRCRSWTGREGLHLYRIRHSDFASASTATEYGLFTDSAFGTIPMAAALFPRLEHRPPHLRQVLLGSEKVGAVLVPMPT